MPGNRGDQRRSMPTSRPMFRDENPAALQMQQQCLEVSWLGVVVFKSEINQSLLVSFCSVIIYLECLFFAVETNTLYAWESG